MKKAPYSLQEAERLCEEYQYLIKKSFSQGSNAIIECVTIAPFDEASRQRFLIFYFLFNNAQKALTQEFKGMLYDILVIGRSVVDEHELLHADLGTWLQDNAAVAEANMSVANEIIG